MKRLLCWLGFHGKGLNYRLKKYGGMYITVQVRECPRCGKELL